MLSVSISSVMLCVSVQSPALRGSGLSAARRVDRSCPHSSERERSISASRCFHRLRSSHELISAFDYLVGEREQFRRYLKAGCARQSTVLDNLKELTLPRKEHAPNTLLPNCQLKAAGRSILLVDLSVGNPSRVTGVLASNHVERKESQCTFLQFYKENDVSI